MQKSLSRRLRNYLITGLLVAGPLFLTFYFAWKAVTLVDGWVSGLVPALANLMGSIPGLGLVLMLLALVAIGGITSNFLGQFFIKQGERLITTMPFLGKFYDLTKQIFATLLGGSKKGFKQVVLLEFPSSNSWAVGFVTNEADPTVAKGIYRKLKKQKPAQKKPALCSVFLPTSPNPTSGYLLFRRKSDLIELPISVEEGMRLIISGGIVSGNGAPK